MGKEAAEEKDETLLLVLNIPHKTLLNLISSVIFTVTTFLLMDISHQSLFIILYYTKLSLPVCDPQKLKEKK